MNRINTKKLLNSKWTAVNMLNKEKHFIITEVEFDFKGNIVFCMIEAIISRRSEKLDWEELKNQANWLQGWQ